MVVIAHAGFLCKKDGVSAAWRRLWFEVKGYRLTYFQREDEFTLFNRSVAKRGQIRLEEVDVRRVFELRRDAMAVQRGAFSLRRLGSSKSMGSRKSRRSRSGVRRMMLQSDRRRRRRKRQ